MTQILLNRFQSTGLNKEEKQSFHGEAATS